GTLKAGVVLLSPEGGLQHVIGTDQGLDAAGITSLYADSQGGLWLTLYNGLARLQLNLTRFDSSSGLNGNVYALARQDGVLYAGTHIGFFRLNESAEHGPLFVAVPGVTSGTISALLPSRNGLLVGAAYGLIRVVNGVAKLELPLDVVSDLYQSTKDGNVLYAAGRRGLFRLRWDGHAWTKDQEVPTNGLDFRSVVEDDNGSVWVATRSDILRVNFTGTTPEVTRYDSRAGVTPDWKFIYRVNGRVVFATNAGLRRFDGRRFVP